MKPLLKVMRGYHNGGERKPLRKTCPMLLTDTQTRIQDTARAFAGKEIAPHALDWDRDNNVPLDVLRKMGALGFMGMLIPPDWGGTRTQDGGADGGTDYLSYTLLTEEISAADGGVCNLMNATNSPVAAALVDHATDAQKERWLRPIAEGQLTGAIALTEPHTGSDASAITTRAVKKDGGWVISGRKQFITGGQTADVCMIIAVTDTDAGKNGISCFYVPTDTPGYQVARLEDKLGHRTSDTAELVFDDMEVPEDALVGGEGNGLRIALAYLGNGRIGVAAQAVGAARAGLEVATAYARERETFGKPIIEHQAVSFMLAEMATKVEVARQMTHHAARLLDAGQPSIKAASMAKLYASQIAEEVCSDAVQIHGGLGFCRGLAEKTLRDCRVYKIYEGTNEIQKLVIGREIAAGR